MLFLNLHILSSLKIDGVKYTSFLSFSYLIAENRKKERRKLVRIAKVRILSANKFKFRRNLESKRTTVGTWQKML